MTNERVRELLAKALEKVAPDLGLHDKELDLTTPINELGLDSVTSMEMVCALEDAVGRRFDDQELAKVRRLDDLAAVLGRGDE